MKNLIFTLCFIAIHFLCLSQHIENEASVTKNKKNIILSVEFPHNMRSSEIPTS